MILSAMEAVTTDLLTENTVIHVISDKFSSFTNDCNILSYNCALQHLDRIARTSSCVVLGQGLNPLEVKTIKEKIQHHSGYRQVLILEQHSARVAKELVHKHDLKNVLITRPQQMAALVFQASLAIDDDCAEMSDHQSGEHVQGALLVEAARQLFMACALSFDIAPEFRSKVGHMQFTLAELETVYHNFIFPVDTRLELAFHEINISGSSASGKAGVKFFQFDQICCEVNFKANAYSQKFLSSLEKRSARRAHKQLENFVATQSMH